MAEISERVSILEVKFENMEESLQRLSVSQKEYLDITMEIKERLDRQNGAIPHMVDDIRGVLETQSKILGRLNKDSQKAEALSFKMKIVWSILALVAGGVVTHFAQILLTR